MSAVMARIRITIDTEDAYKRAFLAWANLEGFSPQELFQSLLNHHCPTDILKRAKLSAPLDEKEEEGETDPEESEPAKRPTRKGGRS